MRPKIRWLVWLVVLISPVFVARATSLPPGFFEEQVAALPGPVTAMEFAPDGRLFVLLQEGTVRVIKDGHLLADPFVTVGVNTSGERGLVGIAFDPDFAVNHYVYLYYTALSVPAHNRLSRFIASGDTADPYSETPLLDLPDLDAYTHNGGAIHFGPDGKLYVAVGENSVADNAQSLDTPLGKMLRINPDGTIPADNPFVASTTGQNQAIWALGLRNPFTFAFDPVAKKMYINDVGGSSWEEIDEGLAGANYGWPVTEGDFPQAAHPSFTQPLYAYPHNPGCAVTGATFYRPQTVQFPAAYLGDYFFADLCANWIEIYNPVSHSVVSFETDTAGSVVDLKVGPDGGLYYLSRVTNGVHVIRYATNPLPVFSQQPQSQTVSTGSPATFTCRASDPTATLQWQSGNEYGFTDIGGAISATYTLAAAGLADSGTQFRCVATNANGSTISQVASLTVVEDIPPVANISLPAQGTLYQAGTRYDYSGTGIDPEDGELPPAAFTWQIDLYHYNLTPADAHVHPFMPATSGQSAGSFTIPNSGETSPHLWYRLWLTVTDSKGLTNRVYRDLHPVTSTMTFLTDPPGLTFSLDGQPLVSPMSVVGVVGMLRTRFAPLMAIVQGQSWQFSSWTGDGYPANGIFVTPAQDATFVAHYTR